VDDQGHQVLPEKFFRKAQEKLAKLQRKLADDQRCKKGKRLIRQKIAKLLGVCHKCPLPECVVL
jgi:DnaJ-domain-containing protein 1